MDDSQALAIGKAVQRAARRLNGPGQVVVHVRADGRPTHVEATAVYREDLRISLDVSDGAAAQ